MGIPTSIREFLDRECGEYRTLFHHRTSTLCQAAEACELPLGQLARAVILTDDRGPLMAVLPADHVLDFSALCALLGRELELVPGNRLGNLFRECEPHSFPPLAPVYELDVVIDASLDELDVITFEPGTHTALIQVERKQFRRMLGNAPTGRISQPVSTLRELSENAESGLSGAVEQLTPARVRRNIEEFHELPSLPATAAQILELATNPLANARQLADIIEQDPALAAQVLRYANSSLYGYAGGIRNLQTAIARVLGFDYVLNIALGFSIGKSLRIPEDGPFGLDAFWKHSVHAARLVEVLARRVPASLRPQRGTAYLAGLLQNIGRLVLGHTFQPEFFILNRFAQANPEMPGRELERHVLGVTHDQIGAWLLEAWGLPEELIVAVRHHHDEDYWERYSTCSQLVLVANRALARYGLGESDEDRLPAFSLQMLGLDEATVLIATEQLIDNSDDLVNLAARLAA